MFNVLVILYSTLNANSNLKPIFMLQANTSILTLITQTEEDKEKLLFMYLKPVDENYPSQPPIWYPGKGQNGKALQVWKKLSIKQWVACGRDEDLEQWFEDILKKKKIPGHSKTLSVTLPDFKREEAFDPETGCGFGTGITTLETRNNSQIPVQFFEKENLDFLCSQKTGSKEIKPLFPLGFFEEDCIHKYLAKGIWGIKHSRIPYLTFHGVRSTSKKGEGSTEMAGFYQGTLEPSYDDYKAVVKNEQGHVIGSGVLNQFGVFHAPLSEPTKKGSVDIVLNETEIRKQDYVLLQGFEINSQIVDTTFKDDYGRSFMISDTNRQRPGGLQPCTWQRQVYAETKKSNEALSDVMKTVLDYLGPRILLADPYFINAIREDEATKSLELTQCQRAFINAVIFSGVEKGIKECQFLGFWGRAKNAPDNSGGDTASKSEIRFERYEKIFKGILSNNKLQSIFPTGTFTFRNAAEDFHNRYWFSINEEEGRTFLNKCVIVTNSIGNMEEVDFMPVVNEEQQALITRKYNLLLAGAQSKLVV